MPSVSGSIDMGNEKEPKKAEGKEDIYSSENNRKKKVSLDKLLSHLTRSYK
jgi:hypothetical protein